MSGFWPDSEVRPSTGRSVRRNLSFSLASRLFSSAANLAFVALTTWLYGKNEVAMLALIGIFTALIDASKGLGLGTELLRSLPRLEAAGGDPAAEEARSSLVVSYLFYSLVPPLVVALATAGMAAPAAAYFFGTAEWQGPVCWGVAIGFFTTVVNTNLLLLQASQRFAALAAVTTIASLLQRVVPCVAGALYGLELTGFLVWSCGLAALAASISAAPCLDLLRSRRIWSPGRFWPQSRHYYSASLVHYLATQTDQLLVAAACEPAALAVYYTLRRLYSIVLMVVGSLLDSLVPHLAGLAAEAAGAARANLQDWIRVSLYGGAIAAAMLTANGGTLINTVLGAGYGDDPWLILLFAVSGLGYLAYGFVQVDLVVFGESQSVFQAAVTAALVHLATGLVLVRLIGASAMPLAISAGYLASIEWSRRRGSLRGWDCGWLWTGLAFVVSVALTVHLGANLGAGRWLQLLLVNAWIAGFAWLHFERWEVGGSLRRIR
jgi:O-antigen/teichoic acid export membrane protein